MFVFILKIRYVNSTPFSFSSIWTLHLKFIYFDHPTRWVDWLPISLTTFQLNIERILGHCFHPYHLSRRMELTIYQRELFPHSLKLYALELNQLYWLVWLSMRFWFDSPSRTSSNFPRSQKNSYQWRSNKQPHPGHHCSKISWPFWSVLVPPYPKFKTWFSCPQCAWSWL